MFENSTTDGEMHLGTVIGTSLYTQKYVAEKVVDWKS